MLQRSSASLASPAFWFMSAQSAVQHVATSAGAMGSAWILHERPDHRLEGIVPLAVGAMALSAVVPLLLAAVAARVRRRDGAPAAAPAVGA